MIKSSCYIREFSEKEKKQLENISNITGLKTAKEVFLYCLDSQSDHENTIARLNRLLEYKQKKINQLQNIEDHE